MAVLYKDWYQSGRLGPSWTLSRYLHVNAKSLKYIIDLIFYAVQFEVKGMDASLSLNQKFHWSIRRLASVILSVAI